MKRFLWIFIGVLALAAIPALAEPPEGDFLGQGLWWLYQARYDPHAMAQFFQIISKKYPQRTVQFFSDHPNPENRIKDVDLEIAHMAPVRGAKTDSPEFQEVKQQMAGIDPPPQLRGTPKIEAKKQPPVSGR